MWTFPRPTLDLCNLSFKTLPMANEYLPLLPRAVIASRK